MNTCKNVVTEKSSAGTLSNNQTLPKQLLQHLCKSIILKERIRRVKLETVHLTSVVLVWKCEYIALIDNFSLNFFFFFSRIKHFDMNAIFCSIFSHRTILYPFLCTLQFGRHRQQCAS